MLLKNNLDRSLIERLHIDISEQLISEDKIEQAEKLTERDIKIINSPLREINVMDIDDKYLYQNMKIREAYDYIKLLIEKPEDTVKYPIIVKNDNTYNLYDGFHRVTALKVFKNNLDNEKVQNIMENNPKIKKIVESGIIEVLDLSKHLEITSELKIIPKKFEFYQFCDKFRTHSKEFEENKRERIWNSMMKSSKRISFDEFENNVDIKNMSFLDEDEKFKEWFNDSMRQESTEDIQAMDNNDNKNKTIGFFKSEVDGNSIFYIRMAGFEAICLNEKQFRLTDNIKKQSIDF